MEGIRQLGSFSSLLDDGVLSFIDNRYDRLVVTYITSTVDGTDRRTFDLGATGVCSFLDDGAADQSLSGTASHNVRLVRISSPRPRLVNLGHADLQDTLEHVGLEHWTGRLLSTWAYGYHHSAPTTGAQSTSYYLGTGHFTAMWTTVRLHGPSYVTKAVIIVQTDNLRDSAGIEIYERIVQRLATFDAISRSPLYLAFVLAVDILTVRESITTDIFTTIQDIERGTGHGSWGRGEPDFLKNQDSIKTHTSKLGRALNQLADIYKHLNMVDLIFEDLETQARQLTDCATNGDVGRSTKSITDAIYILRQQLVQLRDQANYLEVRVRSQSSVLFSLLTHQDAQVNIKAANASVQLAEATRKDGSSMKTIAVLTMVFLPATFFAAFVSIPSLGWTEPDKFALYWACTIPVTAATFMLWAGITQRRAMWDTITELRGFADGKRREWKGGVASTGDSSLTLTKFGSGRGRDEMTGV